MVFFLKLDRSLYILFNSPQRSILITNDGDKNQRRK